MEKNNLKSYFYFQKIINLKTASQKFSFKYIYYNITAKRYSVIAHFNCAIKVVRMECFHC